MITQQPLSTELLEETVSQIMVYLPTNILQNICNNEELVRENLYNSLTSMEQSTNCAILDGCQKELTKRNGNYA